MRSLEDIDKETLKLEKALEEIKQVKKKTLEQLASSPYIKIADNLHTILCKWNHTDGCGWYYEESNGVDDWKGQTHSRYLEKAQKLVDLSGYSPEQINGILKRMIEVK